MLALFAVGCAPVNLAGGVMGHPSDVYVDGRFEDASDGTVMLQVRMRSVNSRVFDVSGASFVVIRVPRDELVGGGRVSLDTSNIPVIGASGAGKSCAVPPLDARGLLEIHAYDGALLRAHLELEARGQKDCVAYGIAFDLDVEAGREWITRGIATWSKAPPTFHARR